ncbi:hypothetical protein SUGI_0509330 [Cryptomeria japonica]|nr:hypothetical protein SUGI_0509330 [Cryptomeria japonica]
MIHHWSRCQKLGVFAKWLGSGQDIRDIVDRWEYTYASQVSISILPNDFIFIICNSEALRNELLHGYLIIFKGYNYMFIEWQRNFDPFVVKHNSNPRWINIPYLPVELLHFDSIVEIGNALGTFIGVDGNFSRSTEVKLLVDMDNNRKNPKPLELITSQEAYFIKANFYKGSVLVNVLTHITNMGSPSINPPSLEKSINLYFNNDVGGFYIEWTKPIDDNDNIDNILGTNSHVKPQSKEVSKSPETTQFVASPPPSPIVEHNEMVLETQRGDHNILLEEGEIKEREEDQIPIELDAVYNLMGLNQLSEEEDDSQDEDNIEVANEKRRLIEAILQMDDQEKQERGNSPSPTSKVNPVFW